MDLRLGLVHNQKETRKNVKIWAYDCTLTMEKRGHRGLEREALRILFLSFGKVRF